MKSPIARATRATRATRAARAARSALGALALGLLWPLAGWSQFSVLIDIAPPPLPVYAQPPVPDEGYIWMPGYWRWSAPERAYYWVPGAWLLAPNSGDLWTPGYWAYDNAGYVWHAGYWGREVGFYGGLDYGYGYNGSGYQGGRWERGAFRYNRAVSNLGNAHPRLVQGAYNTAVAHGPATTHTSFNGGRAGVQVQPTPAQRQMRRAEDAGPTADPLYHEPAALDRSKAAGTHGLPQAAVTPRAAAFTTPGGLGVAADHGVRADRPDRPDHPDHPDQAGQAGHAVPVSPAPQHQPQPQHQAQPQMREPPPPVQPQARHEPPAVDPRAQRPQAQPPAARAPAPARPEHDMRDSRPEPPREEAPRRER